MLEVLCWLAALIVLVGCMLSRGPGKGVRHTEAPWMILYRDGSWRVDTNHPEWQKRFREQIRAAAAVRLHRNG